MQIEIYPENLSDILKSESSAQYASCRVVVVFQLFLCLQCFCGIVYSANIENSKIGLLRFLTSVQILN